MRLEAEIATIKATIADNKAKIAQTQKELDDATKLKEEETAEWKQSDAEDKAAAELVVMAKGVLETFYKDNGLMFVQKAKKAPEVVAGQAPPPPPQTWDAPYGGKTGESAGIISILGMIEEDINKDREKAKKEEEKAMEEFEEFKAKSEAEMKDIS